MEQPHCYFNVANQYTHLLLVFRLTVLYNLCTECLGHHRPDPLSTFIYLNIKLHYEYGQMIEVLPIARQNVWQTTLQTLLLSELPLSSGFTVYLDFHVLFLWSAFFNLSLEMHMYHNFENRNESCIHGLRTIPQKDFRPSLCRRPPSSFSFIRFHNHTLFMTSLAVLHDKRVSSINYAYLAQFKKQFLDYSITS